MLTTKRINASIGPGDEPGSFEAIISTSALDRDGDVIPVDSWVLPDHLPVNTDHSPHVADVIGSGIPYIENGTLRLRATFANTAEAQHIRSLVVDRHLTGCSVEFIKLADGRNELVGVGLVSVPSNPEAKVLAAKAASDVPDWFIQRLDAILSGTYATKAAGDSGEVVQYVHDSAVWLGAECAMPDDAEAEGKAAALRLQLKRLR